MGRGVAWWVSSDFFDILVGPDASEPGAACATGSAVPSGPDNRAATAHSAAEAAAAAGAAVSARGAVTVPAPARAGGGGGGGKGGGGGGAATAAGLDSRLGPVRGLL